MADKKWFAGVAMLAFTTIFYVGGQFECGHISTIGFGISFAVLYAVLVYSTYKAGAFETGEGDKIENTEDKEKI